MAFRADLSDIDTTLAELLRPLTDAGLHISLAYSPHAGGVWTAAYMQVGTTKAKSSPHHPSPSAALLALVALYVPTVS
jgi:hypothetical protein